ncbi:MAG TPA: metallophosphoesterase [Candidatus Kapabacteria bacterium]|nr:metallophosphoesterase [Candidatus Kapabacteria bacterium]
MPKKITKASKAVVAKVRRAFGDPVSAPKPNQRFIPIPPTFKKPSDLVFPLSNVVPSSVITKIKQAGKIVFHTVGDTGGINGGEIQTAIADQMEKQVAAAADSDKPAFFYHLGDVIYYNGISTDYGAQFYEPYQYYPSPILAVPGNHDCDNHPGKNDPPDLEPSMTGFMQNFCDSTPSMSSQSSYRKTMNQPWAYWTLDAPLVTIIGLFSNVDGSLDKHGDSTQYNWLVDQLKKADPNKCLLITLHHPSFSLDMPHGGYPMILSTLDKAFKAAKRMPDAVFSGHVHNYQRFTRTVGKKQIPYVIAGAGGYAHQLRAMHRLQHDPKTNDAIVVPFQTAHKDVILSEYNQDAPGFLRITIDGQFLFGEYFVNSFDTMTPPANSYDVFKLDWKNGSLVAV